MINPAPGLKLPFIILWFPRLSVSRSEKEVCLAHHIPVYLQLPLENVEPLFEPHQFKIIAVSSDRCFQP